MIVKETTVGLGADYVSKILHNTILPFMNVCWKERGVQRENSIHWKTFADFPLTKTTYFSIH
jgi:hypothetical protein